MRDQHSFDIDYVAHLARLELTSQERERFSAQLGDILQHFAQLDEVDVSAVEPMAHAFPVENVFREDKSEPGLSPERALENTSRKRKNMVQVPKVVEG